MTTAQASRRIAPTRISRRRNMRHMLPPWLSKNPTWAWQAAGLAQPCAQHVHEMYSAETKAEVENSWQLLGFRHESPELSGTIKARCSFSVLRSHSSVLP